MPVWSLIAKESSTLRIRLVMVLISVRGASRAHGGGSVKNVRYLAGRGPRATVLHTSVQAAVARKQSEGQLKGYAVQW